MSIRHLWQQQSRASTPRNGRGGNASRRNSCVESRRRIRGLAILTKESPHFFLIRCCVSISKSVNGK